MQGLPLTINTGGELLDFSVPRIMGILNVTPDSFYSPSRKNSVDEILARADEILGEGGEIIDIGACSTRPGSIPPDEDEEYGRLAISLEAIRKRYPEAILSVDTYRASVAKKCLENWNVNIINDIGGGTLDDGMWQLVADFKVAYVLAHTRGCPAVMHRYAEYSDVTAEVISELSKRLTELRGLNVNDVIVDPGFGFAKTPEQSLAILSEFEAFKILGVPLMAGLSRKSMIWKTLDVTPEDSLEGTVALDTVALMKGADIIRVHDVKAASQTIKLLDAMKTAYKNNIHHHS